MNRLKFAALGAGFWARYQLAGWRQAGGTECVAIYNRTRAKAEALAREFGIPAVYDDAAELLKNEKLDFVDVITDVGTHAPYVHLAAAHKLPVVCQKPMATSYQEAERMVKACLEAEVPLFVNENWRWQTPIRHLKRVMGEGSIGRPFRGRIRMVSGFPVFANQPFLKTLDKFILTDIGSHVLDVARYLFGEAARLYCQTQSIHADIAGEDVATVMLDMRDGSTVQVEMGYAENYLEVDRFPETFILVEGERGSAELAPDYWIRVTTKDGTHARRVPPPHYPWADSAYDVVHSSVVPAQENILKGLRGEGGAETTGEDNLKTVRLVFASYESAHTGQAVRIG